MPTKLKRTFKSYVVDDANQKSPKPTQSKSPNSSNAEVFFHTYRDPTMLPGERVIAQAENVLRYSSFTEKKQGMSGALFVTNFKITFITAERSALNSTQAHEQRERNLLIGDMDIPLTGIDTIYQGFAGGKRRKLVPGSTISSKSKYLCVYCQNLRVHQFSFKFTPKDQDKQIMNAIVAFAFPNRPELLFALQYGQQMRKAECSTDIPTFTNHEDWERELIRLDCDGWLSIQANPLYSLCNSLPEYFVIPHSVVVAELREASRLYTDCRVPVWSYSVKNGAALVRMAYLTPDCDTAESDNKYIQAMTKLQASGRPPAVFDLGKLCPSTRDLQQSYDKLKDLAIIDSVKDYWTSDVAWYTSLENTHWLQSVQSCLQVATQVVDELTRQANSVIVKENTARDLCCVVSSLVQVMLDPHYRTVKGFQSLVEKEWVALGHRFQTNHGVLKTEHMHQSPVFLVFLDCVWQLQRQFIASFEFTDTYLVSLWDSVHLGLFENFLFDSIYERDKFCGPLQLGHSRYAVHLPSVWHWPRQFSHEDIALFKNPLYYLHTAAATVPPLPNSSTDRRANVTPTVADRDGGVEDYALKLNSQWTDECSPKLTVLRPKLTMSALQPWRLCYLRWLAPGEIVNGGSQSGYLQQCLLVEEIVSLRHEVEVLALRSYSARRPHSQLIFGQDNLEKSQLLRSSMITSSFPYSPVSPRGQQSYVFMPLLSYVDRSSIKYDYTDSDD